MSLYVSAAFILASIILPLKSYSFVEGKECATQLLSKTEYVVPISEEIEEEEVDY